jgi:hypothetical protein
MPALDLEVLHRSRHEDTFQASGDPRNAGWLQGELTGWLAARKWHQSRWGEFELVARPAGKNKPVAKVRA